MKRKIKYEQRERINRGEPVLVNAASARTRARTRERTHERNPDVANLNRSFLTSQLMISFFFFIMRGLIMGRASYCPQSLLLQRRDRPQEGAPSYHPGLLRDIDFLS